VIYAKQHPKHLSITYQTDGFNAGFDVYQTPATFIPYILVYKGIDPVEAFEAIEKYRNMLGNKDFLEGQD
jgi:hypothetical protein